MSRIDELMRKHGFRATTTGGGNMAYAKIKAGHGGVQMEVLIIADDASGAARLPTSPSEPILVQFEAMAKGHNSGHLLVKYPSAARFFDSIVEEG